MALNYGVIFGAVLLLVGFYRYFQWSYKNYWRKRGIPHLDTTPLPLLGNLWPMVLMRENASTMVERFYDLSREHSMVGLYSTTSPAILVRHPDLVKTVLVTKFSSFKDNGMSVDPDLDPLLAGNPFFTPGSRWKDARTKMTSSFSSAKLRTMFVNVQSVCDKLTDYLNEKLKKSPGEVYEVEMKELFVRFTTENVARSALEVEGNSFDEREAGVFLKMMRAIFMPSVSRTAVVFVSSFLPIIGRIIGTSFVPKEVDRFFRNTVRDVIRDRKERDVRKNDFLNSILTTRGTRETDASAESGDDVVNDVASQVLSFFLDGAETSSVSLSFTGYHVAANPEVQRRLRQEVTSVLQKHGSLTYEALRQMTYMDRVIDESMRLYPALSGLTKVCTETCELRGPDGLSYRAEPGTVVIVPVRGLHKDPDFWENPAEFNPDRFSDEEKKSRPKWTFLPFGEGPRICVGMRMALMQMKAALAAVVSHYSLEVSPRTRIPIALNPSSIFPIPKGGLWTRVKRL